MTKTERKTQNWPAGYLKNTSSHLILASALLERVIRSSQFADEETTVPGRGCGSTRTLD